MADGAEVGRSQIVLNAPIKTIGQYKVPLALHPEVEVGITVTVARSADEAERLARGEDVTVRRTEAEEESAAAAAAAEALFEPEAVKAARGEEGAEGEGAAKQAGAQPGDAPAKATKGKRKKKTEAA
jgi:large subunit ribosomal protein L9